MLYDENNKPRYILPVTYVNDPDKPYISLQDTILLNKTTWQVNPDNRVYLNPKKLQGSHLTLTQGSESISVHASEESASGLPVIAEMRDFQLESLTGMLFDSTFLTGLVNGKFSLGNFTPLTFASDLRIDTLTFLGSRHGNLQAAAKQTNRADMIFISACWGKGMILPARALIVMLPGKWILGCHESPQPETHGTFRITLRGFTQWRASGGSKN